MYYIHILLVRARWESEAEERSQYIINNHIEGKELGCSVIWGSEIYSKHQVKENKKPNSGVLMEDDTDHLGIFRANLSGAKTLIDRYGEHYDSFQIWTDEVEELPYIPTCRDPNTDDITEEEYYSNYRSDSPDLAIITDRNDPRLTSRDYYVVPFGFHY